VQNWIAPKDRSPEDLRARAGEYRRMASTAHTMEILTALSRLADRFEAAADQREQEMHETRAAIAFAGHATGKRVGGDPGC
jgi:hypothetical protein